MFYEKQKCPDYFSHYLLNSPLTAVYSIVAYIALVTLLMSGYRASTARRNWCRLWWKRERGRMSPTRTIAAPPLHSASGHVMLWRHSYDSRLPPASDNPVTVIVFSPVVYKQPNIRPAVYVIHSKRLKCNEMFV